MVALDALNEVFFELTTAFLFRSLRLGADNGITLKPYTFSGIF
jgi:hypothetical protein